MAPITLCKEILSLPRLQTKIAGTDSRSVLETKIVKAKAFSGSSWGLSSSRLWYERPDSNVRLCRRSLGGNGVRRGHFELWMHVDVTCSVSLRAARRGNRELCRASRRVVTSEDVPEPQSNEIEEISFRPATDADMQMIRLMVFSEFMNPLSLERERFVVAEGGDPATLIGVGQIKVLPGDTPLRELRSIVVRKEYRGRSVGTKIVKYLLERMQGQGTVHIMTIGRRVPFYERLGFSEVPPNEVPEPMKFELTLGRLVAVLAAQDRCLCMSIKL